LSSLLAKDVPFHFSKKCAEAFTKLKEALTTGPILYPPIWGEPFGLMCDASDYAVAVVLAQRIVKKPHVIYYANHTLNDPQMSYSVIEKEFLAVVFAIKKFRPYLIGSYVIIFTNHAALKHLLSQKDVKPRLVRWMLPLQEFDCEIRDRKGSKNPFADHLSRIVCTRGTEALFLSAFLTNNYS